MRSTSSCSTPGVEQIGQRHRQGRQRRVVEVANRRDPPGSASSVTGPFSVNVTAKLAPVVPPLSLASRSRAGASLIAVMVIVKVCGATGVDAAVGGAARCPGRPA